MQASNLFIKTSSEVWPKLLPHTLNISMEKKMATHSSILVWRIPWTEEPGGL